MVVSLLKLIGWLVFAVVVLVMTLNGAVMVVSPKKWFRLPSSIRMTGTLRKEQYTAGWGLEIRLAGIAVLIVMAVILAAAFGGR